MERLLGALIVVLLAAGALEVRLATAPTAAGFREPITAASAGGLFLADPARGLVQVGIEGGQTVLGRLPPGLPLSIAETGGGFLLGTESGLYQSDSGVGWRRAPGTPAAHFRAVAVMGSDLIAAAWAGGIWIGRTGEQSWHEAFKPGGGLEVLALAADETSGVVIGAELLGILRSGDRGRTWTRVPAANRMTAVGATADGLVAADWRGGIYSSADGGLNWKRERAVGQGVWAVLAGAGLAGTASGLYSRSGPVGGALAGAEVVELAASGSNLYAELAGGRLYRSRDEARSWSRL